MNVLFVCSQNKLRSVTAERLFSSCEGIEVASAGLDRDATKILTPELADWADLIFVMEKTHRNKLHKLMGSRFNATRVICLDIPDEYELMDEDLIEILKHRTSLYLPATAR
jgi:predicted protein tyrosine phosphatase